MFRATVGIDISSVHKKLPSLVWNLRGQQTRMHSFSASIRLWGLALLIFCGLGLVGVAFLDAPPSTGIPAPSRLVTWGIACLLIAGIWIFWSYKRRRLSRDQAVDELILDVARRYAQTRSLNCVVDEYRANGASDEILSIVRAAPQILKTRSDMKLRVGFQLVFAGSILTAMAYWLARFFAFSHYEVAVGAIGGGLGFIIDGLRKRRAFRV